MDSCCFCCNTSNSNILKNDIFFFVLPISGNLFAFQIGQIIFFIKNTSFLGEKKKPDIAFSCSGGNIAAYIGHASDWNPEGMITSLNFINSQSFLTPWLSNFPISLFFFKSLFSKGYGFEPFLKYFYGNVNHSKRLTLGTEILTGTVCTNLKTKNTIYKIYSNKCCEKASYFKNEKNNKDFIDFSCDNKIDYLKGNIQETSNIISDSASIPYLLNPREKDNCVYKDGGCLYTSTFSIFSNKLFSSGKILKGIFFNPESIECNNYCVVDSSSNETISSDVSLVREIKNLIRGNYCHEIKNFIMTITSFTDMMPFDNPLVYKNIKGTEFSFLMKELEETNYHYGIIFFLSSSKIKTNINLFTNIQFFEIQEDIKNASENISCFVWKRKIEI